jgi:hypothetical protein
MKKWPAVRTLDVVIMALGLGLTGFSGFAAYVRPQNAAQVLIQGPSRKWLFPLDADETVAVPGPLGDTVVRVRAGRAWVESSPCNNQTCVAGGHIHRPGQWAACLPNNIFLMIEGTGDSGDAPDTVAW